MIRLRFQPIIACTVTCILGALGRAQAVRDANLPPGYTKTAPVFRGLGNHNFAVTTDVPLAQKYINQGLVLSYGFNHAEAVRSFREAQKLDPGCAMAYWGESLVLGPNINAPMDAESVPQAWAALRKAQQHAATASEREQDYIRALSARYSEPAPDDRGALDEAFADAMRQLAHKHPNDFDAQSLFAEALMTTTPWDYWLANGEPKEVTREILVTLERVLARSPNHPHANHLYIHTVEIAHPEWGVACADRLGPLVPGAGHLVHMPSHIYVRVGRYADATDANERAVVVDDDYITQCHAQGLYPLAYVPHNHHFLWFSTAMEGNSKRSIHAARHISMHVDQQKMREPGLGTLQHFYVLPLFAMARFGRWDEIIQQPKPADDLKYPTGVWHFARGMARLRNGDAEEATQHLDALQPLAADEELDKVTIWENNTTRHILQLAEQALAGELAAANGDHDVAVGHLRKAVELEDAMSYEEPPLWYAPTRQALGALLLKANRPAEAEAIFREDLATYPNNGWALFGLRQALQAQGKDSEAADIGHQFEQAWSRADVQLTRAAL